MLESMTGYGRGEHTSENYHAVSEIRSVNYRYFEISMKLPSQLQHLEQRLRENVQKKISRGKLSLTVQLDHLAADIKPAHIQEDLLKAKIAILEQVRKLAGIKDPVRLEHLLTFEELFEVSENDPDILKKQFKVVETAIVRSVDQLLEMRRNEGRNLQKDLEQRMSLLRQYCTTIGKNEKERINDGKLRMHERISQLLESERIDEERLEQEIAFMADRLDISEELVRMDSHIEYFTECLKSDTSQGKKLNFILQEMHREVNTIGSKANHTGISHAVVEMKEIIENIREQIQNIA
ncbi:MAG: YicC/YloC family endoribonuclease [Balneolales bacterium]